MTGNCLGANTDQWPPTCPKYKKRCHLPHGGNCFRIVKDRQASEAVDRLANLLEILPEGWFIGRHNGGIFKGKVFWHGKRGENIGAPRCSADTLSELLEKIHAL